MVTVINLFGGPGCGKSTTAAGVFSLLKLHGISVELSTEYAKDLTHKESFKVLKDQLYVLGKQQHKTFIVQDKYKYVITDSPILLSAVYANQDDTAFINFVFDRFGKQNNMNFLLRRVKPYVTVGRNQNEEEAKMIDDKISNLLSLKGVPFQSVLGNEEAINFITTKIVEQEGLALSYYVHQM